MSLPNTYSNIQPHSFYPDRVIINFQYTIAFPHVALTAGLRANGFRRNPAGLASHINLIGVEGYGRVGVPLRISRPRYAAPINCYLDLNLLKVIHESRNDYGGEFSSIRGSTNWLHPSTIEFDNSPIWGLHDAFILRAQSVLSDILFDIQTLCGHRHEARPVCSHISVATLECTIDLFSMNPRQLVHQFLPAFGALLREVECREYPTAALRVIRPEADWMVHGFVASGERIKAYTRTNKRIRFEYRFQPNGFARLGIPRSLSVENPDFSTLFSRCAAQSHDVFVALRDRTRRVLNINSRHTPIDLMCLLASCTKKQEVLREILDCLVRTDKVENALFDRQLVKLLCIRGLLMPALARGQSCVAPRYVRALREIRSGQYNYFTSRLLQGLANSPRPPAPVIARLSATNRASFAH